MITKEKWVRVMQAAGLSEDDMHRWHAKFEELEPNGHQQFLEFIQIPAEEIGKIREWSKLYEAAG